MIKFKNTVKGIDKNFVKSVAGDANIQSAIHDAIHKKYKGNVSKDLSYEEYNNVFIEVAKQIATFFKDKR